MKSPYVNELQLGPLASATFLVQSKEVRQKRTGEPFLSLSLSDRTGDIEAKMWDGVAGVAETFDRDDFVQVKGQIQLFQNRPQITIHKLIRIDEAGVDFADFFPASTRDPEEMFAELRTVIAGIGNPHLQALLTAIFADEEIARGFRTAPAAKIVHHAYLGGLIEHVLSLCHLARFAASHYPGVDLDLLLAGVILHDLGKIRELSYARAFSYTDQGQLLGHMMIALRIIAEKAAQTPDFPPRLRDLLEHMIISHHGELEFGSPKIPLFREALLLHFLDNLDSKMELTRVLLEKDRLTEGSWTPYNSALERALLKTGLYLNPEPAAPERTPAQPAPAAQIAGRRQRNLSLFAEKLQGAIGEES